MHKWAMTIGELIKNKIITEKSRIYVYSKGTAKDFKFKPTYV